MITTQSVIRQLRAELHESRNVAQRALLANAAMESELFAARAAFTVPLPPGESVADGIRGLMAELDKALMALDAAERACQMCRENLEE